MKFYTMAWWHGVQQFDLSDPTADYKAHLALIRDKLPSDLLRLQDSFSLHDARIQHIEFEHATKTLAILLNGDDGRGNALKIKLQYEGVVSFRSIVDPIGGLPGPYGYGDVGYDEVDLVAENQFKHCMLCSTGIELQVVFQDFHLNHGMVH